MKRFVLHLLALMVAAGSFGIGAADLLDDRAAKAVLAKNCIRLGTSELLPIDFQTACRVLEQSELVQAVQEEFAQSVSGDGKVEFPIIENGDGTFHYTNEKQQRTNLAELYRKQTDPHSFDYIVWASGKRFFGDYDVVIHLQVVDAAPAGIVYSVTTHAYPHNWLTRFSARRIGVTKRYFKKKMRLISTIAREIGTGLCEKEAFRNAWLKPAQETTVPLAKDNTEPAPPMKL